jgi:hypothetical protein
MESNWGPRQVRGVKSSEGWYPVFSDGDLGNSSEKADDRPIEVSVNENVQPDAQWLGTTLVCEHRYA